MEPNNISFQEAWPVLEPIFTGIWSFISEMITNKLTGIWNIIKFILNSITVLVKIFGLLISGDWSDIWERIKTIVSIAGDAVRVLLSGAFGLIVIIFRETL